MSALSRLPYFLRLPDLTNPRNGIHAIHLTVGRIQSALETIPRYSPLHMWTSPRIRSIKREFDDLLIPKDHPVRSPKNVWYLPFRRLMITHPTPLILDALKEMKKKEITHSTFLFPALCFYRCTPSAIRIPEPHKLDIWCLKKGADPHDSEDLQDLIRRVLACTVGPLHFQTRKAEHPYTKNGLAIEVLSKKGEWVKVGEGGELSSPLIESAGLDPDVYSGIGIGLGLERVVMLAKQLDSIQFIRSQDR